METMHKATEDITKEAPLSGMADLGRYLDLDGIEAAGSDRFTDGFVHSKSAPYTIIAQTLAGEYEIGHSGSRATVGAGELFLVGPNVPMTITHRFADAGCMAAQWVHVRFTLYKSIDAMSLIDMPMRVTGQDAAEIGEVIGELLGLPKGGSIASSIVAAARISELAYCLLGLICAVSTVKPGGELLLGHSAKMAPVLTYIHEHISGPIQVADLASVACMSESHFYAAFRDAFGQPPMDYVRGLRIAAAARMLAGSAATVVEIADATGFASPYHFSRVFKRETGQSPTEYRRANELLVG